MKERSQYKQIQPNNSEKKVKRPYNGQINHNPNSITSNKRAPIQKQIQKNPTKNQISDHH